jgi:hypothetical protein
MTTVIHKSKGLTPEHKAELEALAALSDGTIDPSHMPEVTDWSGRVRRKFYCPIKKASDAATRRRPDRVVQSKTGGSAELSNGDQCRAAEACRKERREADIN